MFIPAAAFPAATLSPSQTHFSARVGLFISLSLSLSLLLLLPLEPDQLKSTTRKKTFTLSHSFSIYFFLYLFLSIYLSIYFVLSLYFVLSISFSIFIYLFLSFSLFLYFSFNIFLSPLSYSSSANIRLVKRNCLSFSTLFFNSHSLARWLLLLWHQGGPVLQNWFRCHRHHCLELWQYRDVCLEWIRYKGVCIYPQNCTIYAMDYFYAQKLAQSQIPDQHLTVRRYSSSSSAAEKEKRFCSIVHTRKPKTWSYKALNSRPARLLLSLSHSNFPLLPCRAGGGRAVDGFLVSLSLSLSYACSKRKKFGRVKADIRPSKTTRYHLTAAAAGSSSSSLQEKAYSAFLLYSVFRCHLRT